MQSKEELSLKVSKEIVVKFIEMGGVSVNSFEGVWKKNPRRLGLLIFQFNLDKLVKSPI